MSEVPLYVCAREFYSIALESCNGTEAFRKYTEASKLLVCVVTYGV